MIIFPCFPDNHAGTEKECSMHRRSCQSKLGSLKSSVKEPPVISKSLRTILLQDNLLTKYPHLLSSKQLFPGLRVIQLHGNPIKNHNKYTQVEFYPKIKGKTTVIKFHISIFNCFIFYAKLQPSFQDTLILSS